MNHWDDPSVADTWKARLKDSLNEFVVDMLRAVDRHRQRVERERLEAIEKEKRRQQAIELEIARRIESVREDRLLKVVPLWQRSEQVKRYIAAVRHEAVRRTGQIDETASSDIGFAGPSAMRRKLTRCPNIASFQHSPSPLRNWSSFVKNASRNGNLTS